MQSLDGHLPSSLDFARFFFLCFLLAFVIPSLLYSVFINTKIRQAYVPVLAQKRVNAAFVQACCRGAPELERATTCEGVVMTDKDNNSNHNVNDLTKRQTESKVDTNSGKEQLRFGSYRVKSENKEELP